MRFAVLILVAAVGGGCRCGAKPPRPKRQPEPAEIGARPAAAPPPTSTPSATPSGRPPARAIPAETGDRRRALDPAPATAPARAVARPAPAPAAPTAPAEPVAVPPGFRLRGGHLDIDVHRTDVRALLQAIARATRTNLILRSEVQGVVTVQLRNQPVRTALEVVARAVGCRVTEAGRMLIVRCK